MSAVRDPLAGLTFDEATHTYRVDGRRWPSVTQCLDRYAGLEHVDAEVLRRAAEFGTHVHAACHLLNEDRLDWDRLDPALVGHVRGWQRFLDETGAVVLSSETRVVSRRHGFCGTLDARAVWGRERGARLIDIKSTSSLPITTGPQTAAYAEAWHEMTGERMRYRYCCHLYGDGKYTLHPLKDPRDWERFKAALVVHQWLYMPKEKP